MSSLSRGMGLALCIAMPGFAVENAHAQAYPAKPVRMIVPFAPGGGTDIMARLIIPHLAERLGQARFVIENRPGGGGYIGAEVVVRAAPDGYTLFFTAANIVMSLKLFPQQPVDPLRDFVPVSLLTKEPSLLAVHPSLPVKSVKELLALARARPGEINYSSGGIGSSSHLNTELFKMLAKVNFLQVPYSGGTGPAVVGALIGEAPVIIVPISSVLPHSRVGRLRVLAITLPERASTFPDVPAIAETIAGYSAFQWYGVLAPAGTPGDIVDRLNKELAKVMQLPDLRARLLNDGAIVVDGSTPQQFAAHMRDEKDKWARVVEVSGARVQ